MKFKKDKDGKLILDAAGNPIQELDATSDQSMTKEQLDALVLSVVHKAMSPDQIALAVEPIIKKYLDSNGVKPENLRVFAGADADEQKRKAGGTNTVNFMAKLAMDAFARSEGRKPMHGTDFEMLETRRRDMQLTGATTTNVGDFVPPEQSSDFINMVFRDSNKVVARCRRRPMATDSMTIAVLGTGVTAYWVVPVLDTGSMASQAAGLIPESTPVSTHVHLTRHPVHARVLIPRNILRTSLPSMEDIMRVDMPAALAAAIQKAIFLGTATAATDPVAGLDSLITTNAKVWNAGNNLRGILDFLYATGISYGENGQANLVVAGPHAVVSLACLTDKNDRPLNLLTAPNGVVGSKSLVGVEMIEAFCVPATYGGGTDSRIYAGNFGLHANIGFEDGMSIRVNPYRYSAEDLIELIVDGVFGFVPSSEALFAYMNVPTA